MTITIDDTGMDSMQTRVPRDRSFFDQWVTRGLKRRYDAALREPLAPELAAVTRELERSPA